MVKGSFKIGLMIAVLLTLSLSIFFSGVFAGTNNQNIEINNSINIVDIINLNYTVKDTFIYNKKAKEIKFPSIFSNINISEVAIGKKMEAKDCLYLNKTKYFGDAEVKLMEKVNVTKQRINRTWKCNCTNITQKNNQTNLTENKTIEVCQICKEYENYTVEVMREINPENFVLRRGKPIYEVFEGCKKIVKLPNGKWGCSVWTDVYILGQKIKGMTWWNTSWNYRQAINISNTAGDLTKYQVRLDLNSTNVGSNFNWSNNGSDIRFTNSTDDELNFWIEDWNSTGQEAIIWVNVTSLPNNTNTTIYMYYGNPSASSASDGEATFEFFDDFEGDSLNTSKWPSIEGYTPTYSVSNSELYIEPTQTGWTYFISNYQWSAYPMRFIFKAYTNGYYSNEGGFGIIEYYDSTSSNAGGQIVVNQDKIGFLGQPSTDYNDFGTTFTDYSTYHIYTVIESSTTNREISTDTGVSYTGTKDYGSMTKKFAIGLFRQKTYYDYVFVTKYASPEPSVSSFGSEETQIQGYVKDTSGNPISGARVNIIKQSTTGNDTLLATVTTDANGYYSYTTTEKGNFTICAYINSTTQGDCKPFVEIS